MGDRLVDIEAEEGMYRLVEVPVRDSHQLRNPEGQAYVNLDVHPNLGTTTVGTAENNDCYSFITQTFIATIASWLRTYNCHGFCKLFLFFSNPTYHHHIVKVETSMEVGNFSGRLQQQHH